MKKNFQVRNIFKIIFLIFFINNANSYLIFPLEYLPNENYKFIQNKTVQPEEMMKVLFYRNIIAKLELGSPSQNISLFIKLNDDKFYISSSTPSKLSEKKGKESDLYKFDQNYLYNESLSSSFKEGICKSKVHEIFPEKFILENYKVTHPYITPSAFKSWKLKFDNIILTGAKNYTSLKTVTSFTYQMYHIIGTREFYYRIKSLFLNKLIKEQKCFENNFTQDFYIPNIMIFFYCDKSTKDILISSLNSIRFFSMDLDYTFELTYNDLFYIKDNYIYLNAIFSTKEYGFWILGQMFLTKYKFVFNPDKKEIGFYNMNNLNKDKDRKNLSYNKSNKFMSVFLIILLSISFTCVGLLIGRKIYGMRRKIIVNELIEEQNYEYRESKFGSNDIKSNYKQIGNNNNFFEMTKKFSD
jgi:hypothetical protein